MVPDWNVVQFIMFREHRSFLAPDLEFVIFRKKQKYLRKLVESRMTVGGVVGFFI